MNEIEKQLAEDEKELVSIIKGESGEVEKKEPTVKEKIQKEENPPDEKDDKEPEKKEDDKADDAKTDDVNPDEGDKGTGDDEVSPSASAFAKERREKREMAAKIKALEETVAKGATVASVTQTKPVETKPAQETTQAVVDAEPNKTTDYEAWLEWRDRQGEAKAQEASRLAGETAESVKEIRAWREQQQRETQNQELIRNAVEEFVQIEDQYKKVEQLAEHYKQINDFWIHSVLSSIKTFLKTK